MRGKGVIGLILVAGYTSVVGKLGLAQPAYKTTLSTSIGNVKGEEQDCSEPEPKPRDL